MRTTNIGHTAIKYMDTTCWLNDNLFIELAGNDVSVGADIKITEISSGKYRKIKYISDLERLVFPLTDSMKSLYNDSISFNIVVNVYEDGQIVGSFGFDTDVLNGKSLPLRAHGSTRTVYVYNPSDLIKMQLLFPATGKLVVNGITFPVLKPGLNSFNISSVISHSGSYTMCYKAEAKSGGESDMDIVNVFDITPFSAVAQLYFEDESGDVPEDQENKGDIWQDSKFKAKDYCMELVYEMPCDDFDFFKVRYTDTDGCMRYLGGKILSQTTNTDQKNYFRQDTNSVYRNISRKYIVESSGTVKVAYDSLKRDSYWSDVLLSDKIEFLNYDNAWYECSIVDKKVTVNADDSQDVELEFELYIN